VVTTDNAFNNIIMIKALNETCKLFKTDQDYHISCMTHTIQLTIKTMLIIIAIDFDNELKKTT